MDKWVFFGRTLAVLAQRRSTWRNDALIKNGGYTAQFYDFGPGGFRDILPPQTTSDGKIIRRTMGNRLKYVAISS